MGTVIEFRARNVVEQNSGKNPYKGFPSDEQLINAIDTLVTDINMPEELYSPFCTRFLALFIDLADEYGVTTVNPKPKLKHKHNPRKKKKHKQ
jgi:hypothetical protein